ncbi:MAG TPA: multicopper oxidase domain-containing protein [Thermoleophilaceae bacterium]|jgi:FtsP/CotA-like multicopper oxidase with cupredoxin domain|nr:multicopper oxidase domain-containing protein [Thermoleophilaceae bacterium]
MSTNRREFLLAGGAGMAAVVASGGIYGALRDQRAAAATPPQSALAATDGHITLPNRPGDKPLYIFGFRSVPVTTDVQSLVTAYKGKAQHTAPVLDFKQGDDITISLTNLGLVARPDLTDAHTIHWHGFRTPVALFDGVPEVSIAVPLQRQFTYFYRPHAPGTYMYHCHMEDVEHVQMGMTGIVFVRPSQDGNTTLDPLHRSTRFVYNDGDGSTVFDREFPLLLNEIWSIAHDHDENIQESVWTDYDPDYFTINGRVYPQTILPNDDPSLEFQPNSSLMQVNGGDRVLLRLANLGYQQHAMQLPGIGPLKVVGEDATLLRRDTTDLSYRTNTIYIGPGEARDVILTAPPYNAARDGADDGNGLGPYNLYWFRNRDASKLSNNGASGLGGMCTQVRVYRDALPAQTKAGQTYA